MSAASPRYILDGYTAVPVFHVPAGWPMTRKRTLPDGRVETRSITRCGLTLWWARWDPHAADYRDNGYESGGPETARLRLDQVVKFAKPCKRCHPEGATP